MGSQGDQGKQKLADVLGVDESQVSDEAEKRWQEGMKDKDPDELRRSLRDDDDDWADRIYDALAEGGKPHQKGSSHANR
jgi:Mn-dependent DtxR family transcriptional regulator